jgi:hypothetical protein
MYKHFTPGGNSDTRRIIKYTELYTAQRQNPNDLNCVCREKVYNKDLPQPNAVNTSHNMIIAQQINSSKGGRFQYGQYYLGGSPNYNYLGRIAGQPGGSGQPPKNRYM